MKNWIVVPVAALLLTNCGKNPEKENDKSSLEGDVRRSMPDVGTIIIDLPSAIAPAAGSLSLAENSGLQQLFLIPVSMTGMAKQMTVLTKAVVEHIFGKAVCTDDDDSNDLADCDSYRGIISGEISETPTIFEVPGADEETPSHVKYWANPEGSDYEMGLELYWPAESGGYVSGMQMQLSKTGDKQGKGEFIFFPVIGGGDGPDVIVTKFSATDEKKIMEVQLYADGKEGQPTSLGLNVIDADGVITGSGTAIRPEQSADTGPLAPLQTKAEFAYVYTLAGDADRNIGVEKLGMVPVSAYGNESSYFTSYGADGILKSFALELLRNNASPNLDCATMGQVISPSLPTNICKSNTAVTDEQALAGLKDFCTAHPNDGGLCPVAGQASRWANPIYLNASGYVGNEVYQKPDDAAYVPLVEALEAVTVYTPTAFKVLTRPELPAAVEKVE